MRKTLVVLSILLMICITQHAWGTTWYVDRAVNSSGDGLLWNTALRTIQEGIDKASNGDTVIVAQGTYVENIGFKGKNIVLTSTDPLSGTVAANTIIDGNNSGSVLSFSGTEDQTCVVSGFTIRNGLGLLAPSGGGGICGGMEENPTHATIQMNVVTGNRAFFGGALCLCDGTIRNNTITGNSGVYGAGLDRCNGTIQNNFITGNTATYRGGGLLDCSGTIYNNAISGNSATGTGGSAGGGGLCGCNGAIENNTISGNFASKAGGGLAGCNGTIRNCIVWGNTAPQDAQLQESSMPSYCCIQGWTAGGTGNTSMNPQFADPDGADDDPGTCDDNDYRLLPSSPCIDAGMNEDWMWTAVDLDGSARIVGGTVDIGAYEWCSRIVRVAFPTADELQITWTSRLGASYTIWSRPDLLSGEWTEEETISAGGELTEWTDPDTTPACRFYRVEIK